MSLLHAARWRTIPPTFPCERWQPPPSGLQPSGVSPSLQTGKGPEQFLSENQGSRSMFFFWYGLRIWLLFFSGGARSKRRRGRRKERESKSDGRERINEEGKKKKKLTSHRDQTIVKHRKDTSKLSCSLDDPPQHQGRQDPPRWPSVVAHEARRMGRGAEGRPGGRGGGGEKGSIASGDDGEERSCGRQKEGRPASSCSCSPSSPSPSSPSPSPSSPRLRPRRDLRQGHPHAAADAQVAAHG